MIKLKHFSSIQLSGLAMLAGLWLMTRPYRGIWHDGVFYTVQALNSLYPAQFGHDLFFRFGSQDQFTLFSPIYAWVITLFGLDRAALVLTAVGAVLWLVALIRVSGVLIRHESGIRLGALLLVLAWNAHYGAYSVFGYGEAFVTPRVFAEACVLLGLVAYLKEGYRSSLMWLATALVLHPLMALPGIAVLIWLILRGRWSMGPVRLLMGFAMAVPVAVWLGGWIGMGVRFDQEWYDQVRLRSPFLFPDLWQAKDISIWLLDVSLLWVALKNLTESARRLAESALVMTVLGLWTAWVGASLLESQLVTAAQVWRFQWLGHVVGLLLAIPGTMALWKRAVWGRMLAVGMGCTLFMDSDYAGYVLFSFVLIYEVGVFLKPDFRPSALMLGLVALVPLQAVMWWGLRLKPELVIGSAYGMQPIAVLLLSKPVVAMLVWTLIWRAGNKLKWATYFTLTAALTYLVLGIWYWDMRHSGDLYSTPGRLDAIKPAQILIPPQATVYWEGGLQEAWFWLQRANYVSSSQAAGNIFSRGNALETSRRIARLSQLGFQDDNLDWSRLNSINKRSMTSAEQLQGVCSDNSLDFVILRAAATEPPQMDIYDPGMGRHYSIYACDLQRTKLKMTDLGVDKNE